jgi:hypothetical protein
MLALLDALTHALISGLSSRQPRKNAGKSPDGPLIRSIASAMADASIHGVQPSKLAPQAHTLVWGAHPKG